MINAIMQYLRIFPEVSDHVPPELSESMASTSAANQ